MQKLTVLKKKNKESKERTKINSHKLEWVKQLRLMAKREQTLEDELSLFIQSNPILQREARSQRGTSYSLKSNQSKQELVELDENDPKLTKEGSIVTLTD